MVILSLLSPSNQSISTNLQHRITAASASLRVNAALVFDSPVYVLCFVARYAGILIGISNTVATIPGAVSPTLAGALTPNVSRTKCSKS